MPSDPNSTRPSDLQSELSLVEQEARKARLLKGFREDLEAMNLPPELVVLTKPKDSHLS
jgi:hypothetical protein